MSSLWSKIQQFHKTLDLRNRLLLGLSSIILIIIIGQTIILLTEAVVELDYRATTQGTILAQGVATATVSLVAENVPASGFANILKRVAQQVDLEEFSISNDRNVIVAHSDSTRVGTIETDSAEHVFTSGSPGTRMADILRGYSLFEVSAPIVRGTYIVGHVRLRFHSHDIANGIYRQIILATAMGLFWLLVGWTFAYFYVRRITRPLEELTKAVTEMSNEGLGPDDGHAEYTGHDEVNLLQRRFQRLGRSLDSERKTNASLMDSLQVMNSKLGEKVAETTADLQRTMTYLQSIMNCVNLGIVTCDRNGMIVQVNPGATQQLAGLSFPRAGLRVDTLVSDGAILFDSVTRVVADGGSCELVLDRSSERGHDEAHGVSAKRTVRFHAHPLIGPKKLRLGAVITIEDITSQRLIETRLRRQNRLVSMGTMTAGLAHQLGNYLHSIAGFGELLAQDLPQETRPQTNAAILYAESTKAIELIERFLQFARPEETTLRSILLGPIIQDAITLCHYKMLKGRVRVVNQISELGVWVECDPQMLEQVFINIILNAVDAMAGRDVQVLTVSAQFNDGDDCVSILISDTGMGIEAENIERIFDPFFSTKGVDGTGLGLSIAYQVMELHGGRIEVQPGENGGTTFTVVIPIVQQRLNSEGML